MRTSVRPDEGLVVVNHSNLSNQIGIRISADDMEIILRYLKKPQDVDEDEAPGLAYLRHKMALAVSRVREVNAKIAARGYAD